MQTNKQRALDQPTDGATVEMLSVFQLLWIAVCRFLTHFHSAMMMSEFLCSMCIWMELVSGKRCVCVRHMIHILWARTVGRLIDFASVPAGLPLKLCNYFAMESDVDGLTILAHIRIWCAKYIFARTKVSQSNSRSHSRLKSVFYLWWNGNSMQFMGYVHQKLVLSTISLEISIDDSVIIAFDNLTS